jgi:hypothetical protein
MVRKCDPNLVKKEDLVCQLVEINVGDKDELEKLSKNDLVWQSYDLGLLSNIQRDASFVKRQSTIPCYLWTHVTDPSIRETIDKYVKAYSMFMTRGSILANLVVLRIPYPNFDILTYPNQLIALPSILTKDTVIKKCFYPERWLDRRSNQDDIDPLIKNTFIENKIDLDKLLPPERTILCNCGWDNALNHMGAMFLGNLKVQVLTPLTSRLSKFVKSRDFEEGSCNKAIIKFMLQKIQPTTSISVQDFEWVVGFRDLIKLRFNQDIYETEVFNELNNVTWTLHVWLQKVFENDQKSFSRLPYSSLGRKYAYIDSKIATHLFNKKQKDKMLELTKNHSGSELQKMLGLTSQLFNKRRSSIRTALRKKFKNSPKKFKKKWKRIGRSSLPSKAMVRSIQTDGVGLRISLEFNPNRPVIGERTTPSDAFKIGGDNGRVNLTTTTDELGNTTLVKRTNYYDGQRHEFFTNWETKRITGTVYGGALAEMSQAGGFKNSNVQTWQRTLEALGNNVNILRTELLESKDRAKQKMFRFRRKKSFLDCSWKKILKPVIDSVGIRKHKGLPKQVVIVGLGDGKFSHTGRGEKSAPVNGIVKSLKRVQCTLKNKLELRIRWIDEKYTTCCCHKCGNIMEKYPEGHNDHLRYRKCINCNNETIDKRRHRDVNASKNMLKLLTLELAGLPRPQYLINPWQN